MDVSEALFSSSKQAWNCLILYINVTLLYNDYVTIEFYIYIQGSNLGDFSPVPSGHWEWKISVPGPKSWCPDIYKHKHVQDFCSASGALSLENLGARLKISVPRAPDNFEPCIPEID